MAGIIDDPLWNLMLSTHTCDPSCGCDGDFVITSQMVADWLGDFGGEFGRVALHQVDELLTKGPEFEADIASQRGKRFCAPETVTTWLLRWRSGIDEALRTFAPMDVPTIDDANAALADARAEAVEARGRWAERETRAIDAAREDPAWCAAEKAMKRALRKLPGASRRGDAESRSKLRADIESARKIMLPVEEACRARDPEHHVALQRFAAAHSALLGAQSRLTRALAAAVSPSDQSETRSDA